MIATEYKPAPTEALLQQTLIALFSFYSYNTTREKLPEQIQRMYGLQTTQAQRN
jgi:hypothetical protein